MVEHILHDWFQTFAAAWGVSMILLLVRSWRESGQRFKDPQLVIDPVTQAYTHRWHYTTGERVRRLLIEMTVILVIGAALWLMIISPTLS